MEFKNIVFPTDISYNSSSSTIYLTDVKQNKAGYVVSNIRREFPLNKYDVSYGVKNIDDLRKVLNLFHVVQGSGYYFLYVDWLDHSSNNFDRTPNQDDIFLGTGDGNKTTFQLYKQYYYEGETKNRIIYKPKQNSLKVAVNGTLIDNYTLSEKGEIIFDTAPLSGDEITAGFYFYIPVYFHVDEASFSITDFQAGKTKLILQELRID